MAIFMYFLNFTLISETLKHSIFSYCTVNVHFLLQEFILQYEAVSLEMIDMITKARQNDRSTIASLKCRHQSGTY